MPYPKMQIREYLSKYNLWRGLRCQTPDWHESKTVCVTRVPNTFYWSYLFITYVCNIDRLFGTTWTELILAQKWRGSVVDQGTEEAVNWDQQGMMRRAGICFISEGWFNYLHITMWKTRFFTVDYHLWYIINWIWLILRFSFFFYF